MKVRDGIRNRYSCRSYSGKTVSKKVILKLLELANWAPSAGNNQNRHFVVIADKNDREWLAQMNNQPYLGEAPVVILVTTNMGVYFKDKKEYLNDLKRWEMKSSSEVDELEMMKCKWAISDAAVAVENLMLAAMEKGLGTCWIGIMDFAGVRERFDLPKDEEPVCLVTLGYPREKPKYKSGRKSINDLAHWGKW